MRGDDQQQSGMISYVSLEERVPQDHPLRSIRKGVDEVLKTMAKQFDGMYAKTGRPSVPPERLMRAVILQILYTVRSERMLMEQMSYNLLFRWFVGLELDEPVWNHAVFSKNRERLLNHEVAREFFERVLEQAKPYLSDEHFSVDGTLIEAWASQKSFQKKDGDGGEPGQFRGEKRTNQTHESKTDPEAKLYRKGNGQEAKLAYLGHILMENRHGLIVDTMATQADGMAERDAAMLMLYAKWRDRRRSSNATVTVGADKAYDTKVSAQRWSLGLQHMFPLKFKVEASYVGNRNTRLNINRELSYNRAQYFSTSPVRDQATIDALGRTSPNPYSGLNPIYGTVISRGSLLQLQPIFQCTDYRRSCRLLLVSLTAIAH